MQSETTDPTRPHSARIHDYLLGGQDWYEVDRLAALSILDGWPVVATEARANRDFLHRAVHTLAAERGVRQFLDIGSGLPTTPNLHQVAQAAAAHARVVYVDNDPFVVEYAGRLLAATPQGSVSYLQADLRTDDVLGHPHVLNTLDLARPVAVSVVGLLQFMTEAEDPYAMIRRLLAPLAPGSYLVLSHVTSEHDTTGDAARLIAAYGAGGVPLRPRSHHEIAQFFPGLHLLAPGLVAPEEWRPDGRSAQRGVGFFAGVGRKGGGDTVANRYAWGGAGAAGGYLEPPAKPGPGPARWGA